MSKITSHVLDTASGQPAADLRVTLARADQRGAFVDVSERLTDADGRVRDLLGDRALDAGMYSLTFDTGAYFALTERVTFYPRVQVVFQVTAPEAHHHVPLLISPFGYSTYRGS